MTSDSNAQDSVQGLRAQLAAATASVKELRGWLDVIFDTSPLAMGIISAFDNRYVRANAAMAELYGMSLDELYSQDPYSLAVRLTHPDELFVEQKLFAELATGVRRSYTIEKRFLRPDGSFRWGLLTFSGILADPIDAATQAGPLQFAVGQVIDRTEQRAMAEALARREQELRHAQKVDGIGRLAAGIAHDFNNLLTVITGHGEVLKNALRDRSGQPALAEMEEDLEAILAASERAAGLTAQLLAHGRREAVTLRTMRLSEVVGLLQRLLWRTIGSDIQIEQRLAATGAIVADRGQLGQVVMNLVLNARDAMPNGGKLRLETLDVSPDAAAPGPGDWVALVVSDTGHGMTADVRARIFEPFFTTRKDRAGTQGTGLGLSTVQRIVQEMGGHIDTRSAPGEGTTFTLFFPRVEHVARPVEPTRAAPLPAAAPNTQRVLVIEDEPLVRSLIANLLMGAHYLVTVARNGEEGLGFIQAAPEPFQLVVTDLAMPNLGGVALAKRLSERGHPPRMLFISGYSNHTPEELLPYGKLLSKPFTPAQLLAAIADTLSSPNRPA